MGARIGGGRCAKFAETTSTLAIATVLAATAAPMVVQAADLTISNSTNTAVSTSNANNGPGNITVQSGGAINAAPNTVTIDSSHTVSNAGTITNDGATNATGIRALTTATDGSARDLTSTITNTGTINMNGAGPNNAGIRVEGLGTFTGNMLNSNAINIGGNSSYGIRVDAPLTGNLTNNGSISANGTNSYGIATTGAISGAVTHTGTINAFGQDSTGLYVGGTVNGAISIGGKVNATDTTETAGNITVGTLPGTANNGEPVFQVSGKAAVWVAGNVQQGMLITGNGFTKAQESANSSLSTAGESTITSQGGGSALLIAPGGPGGAQNVVVGTQPNSTYSIVNKGNIIASSTLPRNTDPDRVNPYTNPFGIVTTDPGAQFVNVPGVASTGVDIQGSATTSTTLTGGFHNAGGNINVDATNATATGFRIANNAHVPLINNTGDILVTAKDTTLDTSKPSPGNLGGDAYGILVDATSSLNTFTNSGNLVVTSQGRGYNAYGVVDQSGTLTSFTNSGVIQAIISPYNTGITPVAVDLDANTTGVLFTNTGYIQGAVYLGSGTNTVTYSNATQIGDLSFTGGTNTVGITNSTLAGNITLGGGASTVALTNATVSGGIVSTGSANLTMNGSQLTIPDTSRVAVTNATINSTSKVNFSINGTSTDTGVIQASGTVFVGGGATFTPVFTGVIQNQITVNVISSNGLTLGGTPESLFPTSVSYMNPYTVQLDPGNANNLQLTVRRRTATDIGLGPNRGAVYEGSIAALALDAPLATALAAQPTRDSFLAAFQQLMPDTTDATRQTALTNQNLALGAIRRRFDGVPDPMNPERDLSGIWVQALGSAASASAGPTDTMPNYSYWTIGVAVGADWPIGDNTKLGTNLSELFTSIDRDDGPNSSFHVFSSQLSVYARHDMDRFYLQGIFGGGINNYNQRREVTIGTFRRTATGKWNGYQYGGTAEFGVRLEGGKLAIIPYIRAGYLKLHENGYREKNGGDGVNMTRSSRETTSFRTTVGLDVRHQWALNYDSALEADFRASFTRDFKNNPMIYSARFSSAGTPFTLTSVLRGKNTYSFGFGFGHNDSFSSVTLDYDAEIASRLMAHTGTVTLRFRF